MTRRRERLLDQISTVPNILTMARLCIIPFLVLAVLDHHFRTALALFVLAGISDAMDGLLARMLAAHTAVGQYLDPVADKLLLSTLFLVLTHGGLIPLRVTVLVFGRDVIILVVTTLLYVTVGMRDFRPSVFGKANTLAQIVAVATVLTIAGFGAAPWLMAARHWLIEAVVILTTLSAFHYVWLVSVRLRELNQSRHKTLHAA